MNQLTRKFGSLAKAYVNMDINEQLTTEMVLTYCKSKNLGYLQYKKEGQSEYKPYVIQK